MVKTAMHLKNDIESILSEADNLAWQRMGGAWRTTTCVVGKDMLKGIYLANEVIQQFNFNNDNINTKEIESLVAGIRLQAKEYQGFDDEGYVCGMIVQIANDIASLNVGYR